MINSVNQMFGNPSDDGTNALMRFGLALQGGDALNTHMSMLEERRKQSALSRLTPLIEQGDIEGFLAGAAQIDPAYIGKLAEYKLAQQQAMQPDYKVQEVNGALVRYNANDPMSMPEIIAQPEKPMSAKEKREMAEAEQKDLLRKEGAITQGNIVLSTVKTALDQISKPGTSGVVGQIGSMIGGSNAYDLDRTLDTLRANLSFDTLQKMREASPTGGALGSVTENELKLLGSTVASLDVGQTDAQKIANLKKIEKHTQNWMNAMKKAGKSDEAEQIMGTEPKRKIKKWSDF